MTRANTQTNQQERVSNTCPRAVSLPAGQTSHSSAARTTRRCLSAIEYD